MRVRPSAPAPFAASTRSRSLVRVWRAWPPRAKRSAAKARCGSGPPCGLRCAAWRAARCFDRPARGRRGPPGPRGPPAGGRRAAPLRSAPRPGALYSARPRPLRAVAGRGAGSPPAPFLALVPPWCSGRAVLGGPRGPGVPSCGSLRVLAGPRCGFLPRPAFGARGVWPLRRPSARPVGRFARCGGCSAGRKKAPPRHPPPEG